MTVQATTSALAPAAVATRVIAYIIDAIILGICGIIIVGIIISDTTIVGTLAKAIAYAVLGFLYFGYTWTAWRATPGQRVLGLMTVDATSGAAITWNQAILRWAFLFGPSVLNSLFPVGGGLGFLVSLVILAYYIYLLYSTATDPRKQGLHDKQANTLVTAKAAA
jgi:uncharacterized RDD family membrane protein YckC